MIISFFAVHWCKINVTFINDDILNRLRVTQTIVLDQNPGWMTINPLWRGFAAWSWVWSQERPVNGLERRGEHGGGRFNPFSRDLRLVRAQIQCNPHAGLSRVSGARFSLEERHGLIWPGWGEYCTSLKEHIWKNIDWSQRTVKQCLQPEVSPYYLIIVIFMVTLYFFHYDVNHFKHLLNEVYVVFGC